MCAEQASSWRDSAAPTSDCRGVVRHQGINPHGYIQIFKDSVFQGHGMFIAEGVPKVLLSMPMGFYKGQCSLLKPTYTLPMLANAEIECIRK